MLEVVFNESAAGSLKCGIGSTFSIGGAVGVVVTHEDGHPTNDEELETARQEVYKRHRRLVETSVFLDGSASDVFALSGAFSVGKLIDNRPDSLGKKRLEALHLLTRYYPADGTDVAAEFLDSTRKNLNTFLNRVRQGEAVRIWVSSSPDEQCGLYWLAAQLSAAKLTPDITLVSLPLFDERRNGMVVSRTSFGEVPPEEWGRLAQNGFPLPRNYISGLASRWAQLQEENALLRSFVNGQLVSVPEDFYDSFLCRELDVQPEEFFEAKLIGIVMGKYQLSISDGWFAHRIEQFIHDGLLVPLSVPDASSPSYHRTLRKAGKTSLSSPTHHAD